MPLSCAGQMASLFAHVAESRRTRSSRLAACGSAYGCKRQFTIKVKTIFEDSPLGLDKWMVAFWMLANCKNGVSSHELARTLGITQTSAWFMLQRIREVLKGSKFGRHKIGGGPGSEVEADETFVGGKMKNMHRHGRVLINQLGEKFKGKAVVQGMLDRELRQILELQLCQTSNARPCKTKFLAM